MLPSIDFFEKLPVIRMWNDCIKSQVLIAMKKGRKQDCVYAVPLFMFYALKNILNSPPQSHFLAARLKMFSKYR